MPATPTRRGRARAASRARGTPTSPSCPRSRRRRSDLVIPDVGDEREVARALDRATELPLEARVDLRRALGQQLAALGEEARERRDVLEVEQLDRGTLDAAAPSAAPAELGRRVGVVLLLLLLFLVLVPRRRLGLGRALGEDRHPGRRLAFVEHEQIAHHALLELDDALEL